MTVLASSEKIGGRFLIGICTGNRGINYERLRSNQFEIVR